VGALLDVFRMDTEPAVHVAVCAALANLAVSHGASVPSPGVAAGSVLTQRGAETALAISRAGAMDVVCRVLDRAVADPAVAAEACATASALMFHAPGAPPTSPSPVLV
jgi:hypothetical protein